MSYKSFAYVSNERVSVGSSICCRPRLNDAKSMKLHVYSTSGREYAGGCRGPQAATPHCAVPSG